MEKQKYLKRNKKETKERSPRYRGEGKKNERGGGAKKTSEKFLKLHFYSPTKLNIL